MGEILLPSGMRLRLSDWRHVAYYTCLTHFLGLFADDATLPLPAQVLVQPAYTLGPGCPPQPDPITVDELAARIGVSPWRVRCNVAEFLRLEAKGRRRAAERVYARLSRFAYALDRASWLGAGPDPDRASERLADAS